MSVEGIQSGESIALESVLEVEKESKKVDMDISSFARPKICTAFEEIKLINSSKVVIILSDGSQWKVKGENSKAVYETVSKSWAVGDDIRVDDTDDKEFVLKNAREKSAFLVDLSKKCADVSKAFFITKVDPSGYALRTNDGQMWVAGYFGSFTTQDWESGQRIVINKSTHGDQYEDYEMINPQDGFSAWLTQVSV
ncbi:hypothetical protein [Candidatus Neptunichlamydia sp. REUL1]|uniref:hypothetical protein n=1 Tax=Candidatus Neptunichlamydia sp. REUL1 TaxID=3064277 RepID=UPI00292D5077|nr:hypothetical protein [Candidatus Neptunochlamydia sp. REUL1]